MSKPYFEVGDEVIHQKTGRALIVKDVKSHGGGQSHRDGTLLTGDCTCSYGVEGEAITKENDPDSSRILVFGRYCQCALRKKQEPGQDNETFFESLNHPVSEVN